MKQPLGSVPRLLGKLVRWAPEKSGKSARGPWSVPHCNSDDDCGINCDKCDRRKITLQSPEAQFSLLLLRNIFHKRAWKDRCAETHDTNDQTERSVADTALGSHTSYLFFFFFIKCNLTSAVEVLSWISAWEGEMSRDGTQELNDMSQVIYEESQPKQMAHNPSLAKRNDSRLKKDELEGDTSWTSSVAVFGTRSVTFPVLTASKKTGRENRSISIACTSISL